jgi:hypothetical protein
MNACELPTITSCLPRSNTIPCMAHSKKVAVLVPTQTARIRVVARMQIDDLHPPALTPTRKAISSTPREARSLPICSIACGARLMIPSVLISSCITFAADVSTFPTSPSLAGPSHSSSAAGQNSQVNEGTSVRTCICNTRRMRSCVLSDLRTKTAAPYLALHPRS